MTGFSLLQFTLIAAILLATIATASPIIEA